MNLPLFSGEARRLLLVREIRESERVFIVYYLLRSFGDHSPARSPAGRRTLEAENLIVTQPPS